MEKARERTASGQGMHVVDGFLVAQVPGGIEDEALRRFRSDLLARVHATAPKGVVVDVSRVGLLDSASYGLVAGAGRMAAMLGARVVFVGFQPGVVSTLMDLDVDTEDLLTALGLEEGMELLRSLLRPTPAEPEAGQEEEPQPEDPDQDRAKAEDVSA
jgi:rsbT antagonist protein RsbS